MTETNLEKLNEEELTHERAKLEHKLHKIHIEERKRNPDTDKSKEPFIKVNQDRNTLLERIALVLEKLERKMK